MTRMTLEAATAVEGGHERFHATLSPEWGIWGPNGGYLAAVALRVAGEMALIRRPVSITSQFLRTPAFGAVELEAAVLHAGRRTEAIEVRMLQDGRLVTQSLIRTSAEAPGYELQHLHSPPHPRPDAIRSAAPGSAPVLPRDAECYRFWANLERRPLSRTSNEPACTEWVRFQRAATSACPFADAARPLILLDTYGWPAAFRRVGHGAFIAPSLDITTWFHRPATHAAWLLIDETCTVGAHGLIAAHGHVWDESGRLVASGGAQLCCIDRG